MKVRSDVLENYPQDSKLLIVGRVATSLLVIFSYPMQIFPCRNHLRQIFVGTPGVDGTGGVLLYDFDYVIRSVFSCENPRSCDVLLCNLTGLLGEGLDRSPEAENGRFLILTAIIGSCSFGLALALTDLGVILSIVGATVTPI